MNPMNSQPLPPLKERLAAIAAFLPRFEDPDFSFGEWSEARKSESGVFTMPYFCYSKGADAFVETAYTLGWITTDFAWPRWAHSPEAIRLRDDPDCMGHATPEQLSRLLTVVIRQERFCEGSLEDAFTSGLLTNICRRAAQLEQETDDTPEEETP